MKSALTIFFTHFIVLCSPLSAAESYLVMESHSARVLLAYNSEQKRPIANLAKIASAKVALDWAHASQTPLTTLITVPTSSLNFGGANPMNLRPGDRLSIRDAVYSSMLGSDDTAMHALAHHVGSALLSRRGIAGDPHKAFVVEMNQLAKALGMRRTRFASPHGVDPGFWKTSSTAADLARLSVAVMRDTGFTFYVKQKSRKVAVISAAGQNRSYTVSNTNQLLGKIGVNGIKTGLAAQAGECLALNVHKPPLVKKLEDGGAQIRGRDLIVVILGSSDRFGRARQLIAQGWGEHERWGSAGYPVSQNKKEYIVVPVLQRPGTTGSNGASSAQQ